MRKVSGTFAINIFIVIFRFMNMIFVLYKVLLYYILIPIITEHSATVHCGKM